MSFEEFEQEGVSPKDPVPPVETPLSDAAPAEPAAEPAAADAPVDAAAPGPAYTEPEPAFAEPASVYTEAAPKEPEPAPIEPEPQRPVQPYNTDSDERRDWSEPMYESAPAVDPDAYTPGRYAYGAQNAQNAQAPEPRKARKKHSHGFLKAACLVIVCALAAGIASWAVVDYMLDHRDNTQGGKQVVFGSSLGSVDGENASGQDENPGPDASGPDSPVVSGEDLASTEIYKLACRQVVGVNTSLTTNVFGQTSTRAVSGSGFFISADGYILTNYHVISYAVVYGGELTVMTHDGTKYPASIVGYLESNDVAVIKIEGENFSPVAIGDSDRMQVGEWVYAVGNPLGELDYTMTPGMISAQDRMITTEDDITGAQTSINMFQISAAVNSGNSGGPVYNQRGQVVGIVTAKYADEGIEGLGFAIPINDAIAIAQQLVEKGYVAGAGIGITGMNVDTVYTQFTIQRYNIPLGVYVEIVNAGEAADKAGILPQDIIVGIGDKTISSMEELKLALRRYSPGDTDTLTVYRMNSRMTGGETLKLTITFQELIEDTSSQQQQQQQEQEPDYNWPFGGWGGFGG